MKKDKIELAGEPRCRKCVPPERHPGCHSSCEHYLAWKKKHDKVKDKEREERWIDSMVSW